MHIEKVLPTITSFRDFLPIAQRAEAKLSSWGCRYITVTGYEGSLHIDALAKRALGLYRVCRETNTSLSADEEAADDSVSVEIDRVYQKSDELVSQSSCFTRILACIVRTLYKLFEFILNCSTVHGRWEWNQAVR